MPETSFADPQGRLFASNLLQLNVIRSETPYGQTVFDVHVVQAGDGSYLLIEEGDYGELPLHLIDDIVYTATGKMGDEY